MEKLIVGAIVVACLIYVLFRARRTFGASGCGCGCGAEKKGGGCAGCNGCQVRDEGEDAKSTGCRRFE